jgi:hypothetical protein
MEIRGMGKVVLLPGVPVQTGETTLTLVANVVEESKAEPNPAEAAERRNAFPLLQQRIRIAVTCLPSVNYSLVHCDVPIFSTITLSNHSNAALINVDFQLSLHDYAESQQVSVPSVPASGACTVEPHPRFLFDHRRLAELTEPTSAVLEATANGERLRFTSPVQISILPPNAWHCTGHENALAGFVMPNSDAVNEVVTRARRYLRGLLTGARGFADAIESSDPHVVEKTLKALYLCLRQEYEITYEYEPRSYALDWQMIRFHHQVLEELEGTCIDLALLLAACLENVHRDPVVIIVKTGQDALTGTSVQHAVVGCWLNNSRLTAAVLREQDEIRRLVLGEAANILVIDPIGFARTRQFPEGMDFSKAREQGERYISGSLVDHALDVVAARDAGIQPMPFGKGIQFDRVAASAVFHARREAEALRSSALGARHLLLGLLTLENGLIRQVCAHFGHDLADNIALWTRASLPQGRRRRRALLETEDWSAVVRLAKDKAARNGTSLVTEAELSAALLELPTQVDSVLKRGGLTRQQCLERLQELVGARVLSEWRNSGFTSWTTDFTAQGKTP